ncbi:MAG TPA: type II secretion system protein [Methylotenera sp.]|nr:type II secretion system protein [Methylotenera sp.]
MIQGYKNTGSAKKIGLPFCKGFTLIELVVTVAIVAILASVAMPMLQVTAQRMKEHELRASLRQIREAIDLYKKAVDEGHIMKTIDQTGYPPSLEVLVNGVVDVKDLNKNKLRFLRKIPLDPMNLTGVSNNDFTNNWGLRSYASEADSPAEGADVYDVYSLSQQIGTNGVPYAKW